MQIAVAFPHVSGTLGAYIYFAGQQSMEQPVQMNMPLVPPPASSRLDLLGPSMAPTGSTGHADSSSEQSSLEHDLIQLKEGTYKEIGGYDNGYALNS